MKNWNKLFLCLLCLLGAAQLTAQRVKSQQNVYYDQDFKPYTGVYAEFFANGSKRLELTIVNGLPHGLSTLYASSGKLVAVRHYRFGLKDGLWETYGRTGRLSAEARYRMDKKDGLWRIWDDNGILRYEMYYKEGERVGTWQSWDSQGQLLEIKNYE